MFGSPPLIGRTFLADEEKFNGPRAAVISEGLWTHRYHRDSSVLGRLLVLSGAAYAIVGVVPVQFAAPAIDVWLPAQTSPFLRRMREARFFTGVGRIKPASPSSRPGPICRESAAVPRKQIRTGRPWSPVIRSGKPDQAAGR